MQKCSSTFCRFRCITELEIYGSNSFSDGNLYTLLNHTSFHRSLITLKLANLPKITDFSLFGEPNYKLQHLSLRRMRFVSGAEHINCFRLQTMDISLCTGISIQSLKTTVTQNCFLKVLRLSELNDVTSLHICNRNLITCKIVNCKLLATIQVECPSLEHLDFTHCANLTDDSVHKATMYSSAPMLKTLRLNNCRNLVKPVIHNYSVESIEMDFCAKLISPRFLQCFQLGQLSLSYSKITDNELEMLLRNDRGNTPQLRKLAAHKCEQLRQPRISKVSDNLEELDFQGCHNIEQPFFESSSPIRKLNLDWSKVEDLAVTYILRQCAALQSLSLSTCDSLVSPRIESSSLQELFLKGSQGLQSPMIKATKLTHIDFENCISLETPSIEVEGVQNEEPASPIPISPLLQVKLNGTKFGVKQSPIKPMDSVFEEQLELQQREPERVGRARRRLNFD